MADEQYLTENRNDPEWTAKAHELQRDGKLTAEVVDHEGVVTLIVGGPCPRCNDDVDFQQVRTASLPGITAAGESTGAKLSQAAVECRCNQPHPGRPSDVDRGCGVVFTVFPRTGDTSRPLPVKPPTPPGTNTARDLAEWDTLVSSSVQRSTETAEKWRTGLAAMVGVVTSVLLLTGSDAQDISTPCKYWVIASLIAGAVLMVVGLSRALAASAPRLRIQDYDAVIAKHGSVAGFQLNVANDVNESIEQARRWVYAALVFLGIGIVTWWVSPAVVESAEPAASVTVGTEWAGS